MNDNMSFDVIEFIVIGLEPLGNKKIHYIINHVEWFRKLLPKSISSKRFVHSSIFLATKKKFSRMDKKLIYNYDGILIEYGIYDKDRENDYKGQKVNYLGKNGLRYTRYDFMKYQEKIINNNKYKDELLIKHPLICCNIHSKNFFSGLLEKMFFISKDSPLDKPLKPGFGFLKLYQMIMQMKNIRINGKIINIIFLTIIAKYLYLKLSKHYMPPL